MDKKKYRMKEFAAEHSLTLGNHCCYGEYGGYRVHIRYRAMGNPACLITVVTDTKGRNEALEKYLEKKQKAVKAHRVRRGGHRADGQSAALYKYFPPDRRDPR